MKFSWGYGQVRFGRSLIVAASLGAVACVADVEGQDEAPAGSVEESVIGGSAVSVATQRAVGLVNVNGCSGALLGPDWVITATHCIDPHSHFRNSATVLRMDGKTDTRNPSAILQVAQSDITLLKLHPGLTGNQWPTNVTRRVTATDVPLQSRVTCYGLGATAYASPSGVTGGGSYRSLVRGIIGNDFWKLYIRSDANGNNILAPGDSGGSCMLTNGDIAGVTFHGQKVQCVDKTNDDTCKATLTSIDEVALSSTFPFANYINNAPTRAAWTFRPVQLKPGWEATFRSYRPSFALEDGVVYLRGAARVVGSGANEILFNLPAGFRPPVRVTVPATMCGGVQGRLRIETNGDVRVELSNWVDAACSTSFDGVKFSVVGGFTEIALRNGWAHDSSSRRVAARRAADGWVHLQGAMSGGTSNLAFTLAPAFRPPTTVYATVDLCGSTKGRLTIDPSGDATVWEEPGSATRASCFTSLEGVSFFQQGAATFTTLSPINGWTGAPFSTRQPAAMNNNGVVRFGGAVTTNGGNQHMFTLPPAMRPAGQVFLPIDMCNGYRGQLIVREDGQVFAQSTRSWGDVRCFASLEGLSFGL